VKKGLRDQAGMGSGVWLAVFFLGVFLLSLPGFDLFSQALSREDQGLLSGDPIRGRQLFVSKGCFECHAIRGVGGAVGPDLGLKVFNKSVYEIGGVLWNHSPLMSQKMAQLGVQRPEFTESEMLNLISFLFFLNYFDSLADPQRGAQLWTERRCASCHSAGNQMGTSAPEVDRIESPNAVSLAQGMWNHGVQMLEMFRRMDVPFPAFRGSEMVDLAAYIRQQNRSPSRALLEVGDPAEGEELFRVKGCRSCHQTGGVQAPELGGPQFQATVSQIAGQMWNHLPRMSEQMNRQGIRFPTFSGSEMSHLIAYLYSRAYVGKPGDAERGEMVFREKGCVNCHTIGASDPPTSILDLAAVSMDSPLGVIPAMWNHALNMELQMKTRDLAWPRFEGSEMADLQAYLQKQRSSSSR